MEENRRLARQAGTYRTELETTRARQEAERQAAEAQRTAELRAQLLEELGDDAPSFAEFAQRLNEDPVAAAKAFREMRAAAQSQPPAPAPPATTPPAGGTPPVAPQAPQPPRAPQLGVSASAPLGQPSQSQDDLAESYDRSFRQVVEQNRSLTTRARVTDRIRATAIGSFLKGQLVKQHGVDPDLTLRR